LVKILKLAILLILLTACIAAPWAYAFTYALDDGTGEGALALPQLGADFIWANQFTVVPGAELITGIWVAFGPPSLLGTNLDGAPVTVSLWSDPNGDGSPTGDAVLLTSAVGTVANYFTDTFNFYDIPDTVVSGSFFVAATIHASSLEVNYFVRYDNNTNPSPPRSFGTVFDLSSAPSQGYPFKTFMIRAEDGPATPVPGPVSIDIKPSSFPNSINIKKNRVVPVAILTTDIFDATDVDPSTLLFGKNGDEASPARTALKDVDGDGVPDMILHFNTQDTGLWCGDTSAFLTGETFDGQPIVGSDSIKIVGCK
jgi:hypothetical protein